MHHDTPAFLSLCFRSEGLAAQSPLFPPSLSLSQVTSTPDFSVCGSVCDRVFDFENVLVELPTVPEGFFFAFFQILICLVWIAFVFPSVSVMPAFRECERVMTMSMSQMREMVISAVDD